MVVFERDKNFGNLVLAKLKTGITFAPGIKMTIIIYAFGIEKVSHTVTTGFLGSPKLEKLAVY